MANIGIIGLGLIGGSMAKALKLHTENTVFGTDKSDDILKTALQEKSIDKILENNSLKECDIIIAALYPKDTVSFISENMEKFKKGAIITDCAGVKEPVCRTLSKLSEENGVFFVGGHPMAGIEKSGYSNSAAELFSGASMILCQDEFTDKNALEILTQLFLSIGFSKITLTAAREHDEIIAYTSQLAHIVSNAYIKSETARKQSGFSAGSFKDLTRVAQLNEHMWTELFFENRKYLLTELKNLIKNLGEYAEALENDNQSAMKSLLYDGKKAKEANL